MMIEANRRVFVTRMSEADIVKQGHLRRLKVFTSSDPQPRAQRLALFNLRNATTFNVNVFLLFFEGLKLAFLFLVSFGVFAREYIIIVFAFASS